MEGRAPILPSILGVLVLHPAVALSRRGFYQTVELLEPRYPSAMVVPAFPAFNAVLRDAFNVFGLGSRASRITFTLEAFSRLGTNKIRNLGLTKTVRLRLTFCPGLVRAAAETTHTSRRDNG